VTRKSDGSVAKRFVLAKGVDYWDLGFTYEHAILDIHTAFLKRLDAVEPFLEHENTYHMQTY
jgi:hypothetical protein